MICLGKCAQQMRSHTCQGNRIAILARRAASTSFLKRLQKRSKEHPTEPIEIALNPAELGRVRMVMSTSETGIMVTVAQPIVATRWT